MVLLRGHINKGPELNFFKQGPGAGLHLLAEWVKNCRFGDFSFGFALLTSLSF